MTTSLIKEQDALEFKADFFPMTVIKLTNSYPHIIRNQVSATIAAAPAYFKNAPVVIDVSTLTTENQTFDLDAICQLLQDKNMIPVGIRGLEQSAHPAALAKGLAIMRPPKTASEKKANPSLASGSISRSDTSNKIKVTSRPVTTQLVTSPVRSGSQIYARGGDLIVTAAVNTGAECFADGNIHIYGPLRGKALAGACGNDKARIFCASLEAELISISGHYLTSENIKVPASDKPMIQIYLKEGKILIEGI